MISSITEKRANDIFFSCRIAASVGAQEIYTNDIKHFTGLAIGLTIKVIDVKSVTYQQDLPYSN